MKEQFDDLVRLEFFANIGKAITSSGNLNDVLAAVMNQIANIFAPSNWSLLLRKHKTGELVFVRVTGSAVEALEGKVLPKGQGIAGWIAENGLPLVIPDVALDHRFDPSMDAESGFKTKSIIGVPLKTRTRVFGVIELVNRIDGKSFSPYDLKLLTTIADFAAIAIEKVYYMQTLRHVAITDPLTGLYNRRLLHNAIHREILRAERDKQPFCLLFLDINNFKGINDTYGHDVGDDVLREVASLLKKVLRKSDFTCRWGGDEFVVILNSHTEADAELLRSRIMEESESLKDKFNFSIGLSIGLSEGSGSTTARDILRAVDKDMYDEKMERIERELEDMPTALEDALGE